MKSIVIFLVTLVLAGPTAHAGLPKNCDDSKTFFKPCSDQKQIYLEAAARAINEKKLLFVIYGADWCPTCLEVESFLVKPELWARLSNRMILVKVADSFLDTTRHFQGVQSGYDVLRALGDAESFTKEETKGMPIMMVVDPISLKHVVVSLHDINSFSKGTDDVNIPGAINAAADKMMKRINSGEATGLINPNPLKTN